MIGPDSPAGAASDSAPDQPPGSKPKSAGLTIMLLTVNERERQVLSVAFGQSGITIVTSTASYANYVLVLQYLPDIIILELPRLCAEQLHFSHLIRQHKKTRNLFIIGYGDTVIEGIRKGFIKRGISHYCERPLKFNRLMELIQRQAKTLKKELQVKLKPDKERDLERIWDTGTLFSQKLEIITSHVTKLLAFPFTIARVLQLTGDDDSSANDLARTIEADPVITITMLKVSNSVFFSTGNKKVHSIREAIVRIGFRETKRIVMGIAVMNLFKTTTSSPGFDRVDFWYHAVAGAIVAAHIARNMEGVSSEEAFLAGLLHDFGIIIYDEFFPTVFGRLLERNVQLCGQFINTEKSLLSFTHNDVAGELFTNWKLPEPIIAGVIRHPEFQNLRDSLVDTGNKLALCAGIGNLCAKTISLGRECDQFVTPIDNWVFDAIRMPHGFVSTFFKAVIDELAIFSRFFKLDARDFRHGCGLDAPESIAIGIINCAGDRYCPPRHYLEYQGLTVTMLNKAPGPTLTLTALLIWTGPETTVKHLLEYLPGSVYSGPDAAAKRDTAVPAIIFIRRTGVLCDAPFLKDRRVIPAEFDLRVLDQHLAEIVSGAKVSAA
jgi:HD-like signal output (HDOD) protein